MIAMVVYGDHVAQYIEVGLLTITKAIGFVLRSFGYLVFGAIAVGLIAAFVGLIVAMIAAP
jgi:hypothetical protein